MAKRKTKTDKPQVNKDLKGFDIQINPFGEIVTSYDLDKINEFLNKNVDDKKLRDRPGLKSSAEDEEPAPKE
ncbi:MAG TPA: hypothetical protein VF691_09920 [Cytophagaceae bacterium]|jgi:hypothetical protein